MVATIDQRGKIRFLAIALIIIGICFRFYNLEQKFFWVDEVYTSVQISGYTVKEMTSQLQTGQPIPVENLAKYQYPQTERSALSTVQTLALEDSQHVPLYHVLVRAWVQFFGNSVWSLRSFSILPSLLTLPCLYWLCRELFESPQVGWMAMALSAISPLHVIYAQEARPYALYMLVIILSSAMLLRALARSNQKNWLLYMATIIVGSYTQIFFALIGIAHGLYVLMLEKFRFSKQFLSYLSASLLALVFFLPWLWIILNAPNRFDAASWANTPSTLTSSAIRWFGIFSRTYLDFGVSPSSPKSQQILLVPAILMLCVLMAYALYYLCKNTPRKTYLFILTMIGVTGGVFLFPDFILGLRYGTVRHLIPCHLGIQIAVAYLLTDKLTVVATRPQMRQVFWGVTGLLVITGVASCWFSSQSVMWWNKFPERYSAFIPTAEKINQAEQPLVISDAGLISIQILGRLLDPKTKLLLVNETEVPQIPSKAQEVFLFMPSDHLQIAMEGSATRPLERITELLWQLN